MASREVGAAGDDPFANVNLDDSWAAAAVVRERSAAEREWAGKRARWAAADRKAARRRWTAQRKAVRARRRTPWRRVWPCLAIATLAVGLFGVQRVTGWQPGTPLTSPPVNAPPGGVGEQPQRIIPAVNAPGSSRDYVISNTNSDGSPVTFSPCRPWPVVVNATNAPTDGYAAVAESVQEVSRVTGLQLVVEGTTTEAAGDEGRVAYQPDRYGERWAPILVAWTTGGAEQGFAGHGGPTLITLPDGDSHYVTGQVTIDADGPFNRDPRALRALLLHELGHVVGLTHAASPNELMAATSRGQASYGPGDLAGLAILGQGECTNDV